VRVTVIAAGFDASGPGRTPIVSNTSTAAAGTGITPGKAGRISSSLFEPVDALSVPVPTNGATFDIGGGEDEDVDVPPFMRR
jgi:cell division protein FtsZ